MSRNLLLSYFSPSEGACCDDSCQYRLAAGNFSCRPASSCQEEAFCEYPLPTHKTLYGHIVTYMQNSDSSDNNCFSK